MIQKQIKGREESAGRETQGKRVSDRLKEGRRIMFFVLDEYM